ncbi:hypothetical protein [Kitasatospora sp. NPDC057223]|uniref:hypothetical protein n=1 Tax=Kitasatospora sp. NPDC057223 TaxID=3346055 RepID=UPI00363348DF
MATNRQFRRLASAAVIVLAAGVIAAPGAAAAAADKPTVTDPKAAPAPGFASTGVSTDACDPTTTPGWLGLSTGGPTLTAVVQAGTDNTTAISTRFVVKDVSGAEPERVFRGDTPAGAPGRVSIQATGLADGRSYAWHAKAFQGERHSKPTADCHFRLDLRAPGLTVASTDFPASGSGAQPLKYAGETGTFTITGTDPAPAGGQASGVACYQYALAPAGLSVGKHCGDPGTVAAAADGGAAVQVKPADWGSNVLAVQAVDNAGNVSQPVSYSFYAPWDNRPKPSADGDVDGDAVPDILLPDAAGNLQIISAAATGTAPSSVVPAALAPGGSRTWTGTEVLHRGSTASHAPVDDLLVRAPGNPGTLYAYRNFASGDFGSQYPVLADHPDATSCYDLGAAPVDCPAGYAEDWSAAEQLVALGNAYAPDRNMPVLVSVEHGNLLAYYPGSFSYSAVQLLTTTGTWTGYDLIAPGADAGGNLALWARERATGQLHAYPIPKKADGTLDFGALADPAAGVVADGFTVGAYPVLGSSGDGDGDGAPDLWAVTAGRHLVTFSGHTAPKDLGALR